MKLLNLVEQAANERLPVGVKSKWSQVEMMKREGRCWNFHGVGNPTRSVNHKFTSMKMQPLAHVVRI
jgi:hypothetical protein